MRALISPTSAISFTMTDCHKQSVPVVFDQASGMGDPMSELELDDYTKVTVEYHGKPYPPYYRAIHSGLNGRVINDYTAVGKDLFAVKLQKYLVDYEERLANRILDGCIHMTLDPKTPFPADSLRSATLHLSGQMLLSAEEDHEIDVTARWSPATIRMKLDNNLFGLTFNRISFETRTEPSCRNFLQAYQLAFYDMAYIHRLEFDADTEGSLALHDGTVFLSGSIEINGRSIPILPTAGFTMSQTRKELDP